jgi:class 3 adenylate cyclase
MADDRPSYTELDELCQRLQSQASKHLHTQQELINAKGRLDHELELFRHIHQYVQRALATDALDEFTALTLESIIEAFELEVSLFLAADGDSHLKILDRFGLDDAEDQLPWSSEWLEVRAGSARVVEADDALLAAWAELELSQAIVCPWMDRDGSFRGLIVGGVTQESSDLYARLENEIESAFGLLAQQAGSLWVRKELDAELVGLTRSYSRFVPFEFLDLLGRESIQDIRIGDQVELDMTVLFSDLRGFTRLSEELTTDEVFRVLNEYLAAMEPEIRSEGGFINQFQGDAIMALFTGAAAGADAGVRSGIAMHRALEKLNDERRTRGDALLAAGVGLHSGGLMLGAIGGAHRMDSNVVGDTANLASRIEGCTKIYGAHMVISELTRAQLEDPEAYELRELDRVVVKGRREPVAIYEVLDADPQRLREAKRAYDEQFVEAVGMYRRGAFREARLQFMACMLAEPDDGPANLYVDRCGDLARNPPYYWDGITVLDRK